MDYSNIISVSIDRNIELIETFQEKKWNMPCKNVWLNKVEYKTIRDIF